VKERETRKVY